MSPEAPVPSASATRSAGLPLSSVDLLQSLLDGSPDSIYFKDRESRFVMVSRGMARLLGLADPQEAYGKRDHDFFTREHADQALADERRIIETGEPVIDLNEKETWPDGRVTWASSTKLPLRDPKGRIVGTFGISRDVTARKTAEQRLQQAQRELQDSSQRTAVAAFASRVLSDALGSLETAQVKTGRIRRLAQRNSAHTLKTITEQLSARLPDGSPEQRLAAELIGVAAAAVAEQKAFAEEASELDHSLRQLIRNLSCDESVK